ncbi:phosphoserine phosphatase SerB [Pararhizobium haloflavum]|uniref:phosphoserine phosphatase SerB n=1 Tax=Pararhizobium haloflavum TaxID=2037914 RepID=UPI000C18FC96|nr:phosphoserine phosphatase SerB [Pararhizobium haloflavum]
MALVATLIADPANPSVSSDLAEGTAEALDASGLSWLADGVACDIALKDGTDKAAVQREIAEHIGEAPVDCVIQEAETRRRRLLIADMDSTMIGQECIDELADEIGVKAHVAAITERAMNGEIAFEPALRERVGLLKGLPLSVIAKVIAERITLTPGGRELVATMKKQGAYTALVSGGFTAFTEKVADQLGFDEHRANTLISEGGVLAGAVQEPILGKQAKLDALIALCADRGIAHDEVMAVGDGANDLAMIERAGAGVALHAKPAVAARAGFRIDYGDLTALLYMQGYRRTDFVT